jgi:hypothetical protein
MDISTLTGTLIGIGAGFALSVILWFLTVKVLIAHVDVVDETLHEEQSRDGTYRYWFSIENKGYRDALDVSVTCTLFSRGWGTDDDAIIATIDIPVSVHRIDVMPGKRLFVNRDHRINRIGARLIYLNFKDITSFQKEKLTSAEQSLLQSREMRFAELAGLGKDSFLSVVLYATDSFTGARSVYRDREFTVARPV